MSAEPGLYLLPPPPEVIKLLEGLRSVVIKPTEKKETVNNQEEKCS